jgi:hypothetical protein
VSVSGARTGDALAGEIGCPGGFEQASLSAYGVEAGFGEQEKSGHDTLNCLQLDSNGKGPK